MSLYQLSKLLYLLNSDETEKQIFRENPSKILEKYDLTQEERAAFLEQDIGLIYVLGVNGQILMHFAALCGVSWPDYLQKMRDGVSKYGPVRAGLYKMTTETTEKVAGV